jgi:hypothetical protein
MEAHLAPRPWSAAQPRAATVMLLLELPSGL